VLSAAANLRLILCLVMLAACGMQAGAHGQSRTYKETRRLLSEFDGRLTPDVLAKLFREGDQHIEELVRALDDSDHNISRNAQVIIRYLGNEAGMRELIEWYGRPRKETMITAPVPLPLREWDYDFIRHNYINDPKPPGVFLPEYAYALSFDGSEKAKQMLAGLRQKWGEVPVETPLGYALKGIDEGRPGALPAGDDDVARSVLEHAFFVLPADKKYTSARLIGFNGAKDRALVEIYINRGVLAEEWYHVVVSKQGGGWGFFSVTQVAIS
jgi:hypothetical protein